MNHVTPDNRHKHLIVRAEISKPPLDGDQEAVCAWMSKLISDIGMKELAAPRARYCPVEGNRGLTADAIIETSHCVIHTWDECTPAIAQFDLYTCSDLDVEQVIKAMDVFGPSTVEYKFLDREHSLLVIGETTLLSKIVTLIRYWADRLLGR